MKVQIWSDFVCPFCYIGKKRLEQAIKELGKEDEVEIEMMSFELDPNYKDDLSMSYHEMMAAKYNMQYEEAKARNEYTGKMAAEVGLDYQFDKMKYSNTLKAHRVFQKAKELGIGNQVAEGLMEGFFTHGLYLNDDQKLIDWVKNYGLSEADARDALENEEYALKVRQDEHWARAINVKGAPHFVIDDKVSVSGAQPLEVLKGALSHVELLNSMEDGMVCTDEGCEI